MISVHTGKMFNVQMTVHRAKFLIIKPANTPISQIYFWTETLQVSDSFSVHHQEFLTVHTAVVYVIQFCRQLASRSICSCSQAVCCFETARWSHLQKSKDFHGTLDPCKGYHYAVSKHRSTSNGATSQKSRHVQCIA